MVPQLLSNALGSTVKEAAERLALRRQLGAEIRRLKEAGNTKEAERLETLQKNPVMLTAVTEKKADILEMIKNNPVLASTLIGGAGGAAFGGLTSLNRPKEERQTGHNMLTGALAGGALGLGGSLAATRLPKAMFGKPEPVSTPITFPHNGQQVTIDSAKLLSDPSVTKIIDEKSQRNFIQKGIDTAGDGVKSYMSNHPLLSGLMAGDALNSLTRRLGQTGEQRHYPTHAGEAIYKHFSKEKQEGALGKAMSGLGADRINQNIRNMNSGDPFKGLSGEDLDKARDMFSHTRAAVDEVGATDNIFRSARNIYEKFRPSKANPSSLSGYTDTGAPAAGGFNKTLRFMNKRLPTGYRWGARAGLYAGIPAAQYVLGQYGEGNANRQALEDIVQNARVH